MRTTIAKTRWMLAAGLLLAAHSASAAPQDEPIVANVPFDFVVGRTQMPAGKYVVKPQYDNPTVVLVESSDGHHASYALTVPLTEQRGEQTQLVFVKRENQYVLTRLMTSEGDGREIVLSR